MLEVHYVDYGKSIVTFETRKYEFFKFALFLSLISLLCSLPYCINFRICLSISIKVTPGILIWIAMNLYIS